jgi:hypothetical protein
VGHNPDEVGGRIDVFDLDAGQVREEGIETLVITCPASSRPQVQPWGRFHHEM